MEKKIGFIGLGNMGMPIAKNLIDAGYHLQVYNRTTLKTEELDSTSIAICRTPAEAADGVKILISILSEDEVLKEAVTGKEGILKTFPTGGVHISMSTIAPDTAEDLYKLHKNSGSTYIASPVFGRPDAAAAKKLFICISGEAEAKEIAKPILECLGQRITDFGEKVSGANVVKVAGNFMIMVSMEMMAEAYTLAEKNGLNRAQVADFFGSTLFAAPIFQNYGKLIANKQFEPVGFKTKLGFKDARLALKLSQASFTPMPTVSLVHNRLQSAVAKGWGESDWVEGVSRGVSEDAGV